MRILCAVGWHKPSQKIIENEGRTYSRCKRCGADLIKVGEGWKTAPRGYRVIWKDPNAPEAPTGTAKVPARRKPRSGAKNKAPAKKAGRRKSEVVNVAAAAKAVEAAEAEAAGKNAAPKKGAAKDAPAKDGAANGSAAGESGPPKRRRVERRVSKDKALPAKLGGKDRRRTRNRREGFGKKPDVEA